MNVSDAVNLVLAECQAQQSETSQHTYRWLGRNLKARWGDLSLDALLRKDVQGWANIRRHEVKPATLRIEISFLNRAYQTAIAHGWEGGIPTANLKLPRIDNHRERILEACEEPILARELGRREFSLCLFAIHTGLRRLEQFRLRIDEVKIWEVERRPVPGGLEVVRNGMAKVRTSKTGKSRQCPLNQVAAAIAHRWIQEGGPHLFLPKRTGKRWLLAKDFSDKIFTPAVKRAGLENFTWHSLRHTCATRALLAGATLHEVSRLLGHSSITQTERYVHWLEEHLWPAAHALCKP